MVVATILERNIELSFQKPVDMDKVRVDHILIIPYVLTINYLYNYLGLTDCFKYIRNILKLVHVI